MLIHCGRLRCKSMKRGKEMAITVLIYFSPYISCTFFLPYGGGVTMFGLLFFSFFLCTASTLYSDTDTSL